MVESAETIIAVRLRARVLFVESKLKNDRPAKSTRQSAWPLEFHFEEANPSVLGLFLARQRTTGQVAQLRSAIHAALVDLVPGG
jgi:hypothetical protein